MPLRSHKLGSDEVRRQWRDVLDEVQAGESVIVSRAGKRVAVIIPFELWDLAKDQLENLDDTLDLRKKIDAYRRAVAAGLEERDPTWDRLADEEVAAGYLAPLEEKEAA